MPAEPSPLVVLADVVSEILYRIAGWLLVGLGAFGLVVTALRGLNRAVPSNTTASVVVGLLSLLFLGAGVYVNPRLRRRIARQ